MSYNIYASSSTSAKDYIILSSGLGGHASFWQPQIASLRKYFHVITYDQEGCHSDSEILKNDYTMTDMAQQVLNILEQEKIDTCHFVGHALGGHIGAELAILMKNQNKTLLSLTSINAWDELDPHTQKCFTARIALLKHAGQEAYVQAQALFLYPPAWISKNIEMIQQAEQKLLADFPPQQNVLARLTALQNFKINQNHRNALKNTQIHLIVNLDDFLVPHQKTIDLYHKLGHGKYSVLDTGAHASTVTESEKLNEIIVNFLVQ